MSPHYPLQRVKQLLKEGRFLIRDNAIQSALDDFGWDADGIVRCLRMLNDRPYRADRNRNHFYKTEQHTRIPNTKMDYYRAKGIMDGINLYTHFYIHPETGYLIISSFKELEL